MMSAKITPDHVTRKAIVYVRQSTPTQVRENLESQRRQYALVDYARTLGFADVELIDQDLGHSGATLAGRVGFQRLVAKVSLAAVGAGLEASRLARNNRDWHHLIDLSGLVGTLLIDPEGVYDPRLSNDRLLLGLKGTMSEFELTLFRQRSLEARHQKAVRGELRIPIPAGFCWTMEGLLEKKPDLRVQQAIDMVNLPRFGGHLRRGEDASRSPRGEASAAEVYGGVQGGGGAAGPGYRCSSTSQSPRFDPSAALSMKSYSSGQSSFIKSRLVTMPTTRPRLVTNSR